MIPLSTVDFEVSILQLKRGQGVGVLRAACPNTFSVEFEYSVSRVSTVQS